MTPTSPQEMNLYVKELRGVIREALVDYPDGRHVVLWGWREDVSWNQMQKAAGMTSKALSEALAAVDAHVEQAVRDYARS